MPADRFLHQRAGHSHKVSMLTDLEYRVWTQYLLSADDFGVMRKTANKLKADNDHLANRPSKIIDHCLDALVSSGLLREFDHQGHLFVYQDDWQDWQKVTWPAKTINPVPPLDHLTDATKLLCSVHPGAKKVPKKSESSSEVLQENSERTSENLSSSRARVRAERLMANGYGSKEEESGAEAFAAFQAAYPPARVKGNYLVMTQFLEECRKAGGASVLMEALVNHNASQQWADGKIPGMDTWLREERWRQRLEPKGAAVATDANLPGWARKAKERAAAAKAVSQ